MTTQTRLKATTMFPFAQYRDAHAAIDWLCRAFGFERREVNEGDDGSVMHAELGYGGSVFMLGSSGRAEDSLGLSDPARLGGISGGVYVVVDDADAHHRQATAAGAEIVRPPADTFYGSREYTARDTEGHLWSFGTYQPSSAA